MFGFMWAILFSSGSFEPDSPVEINPLEAKVMARALNFVRGLEAKAGVVEIGVIYDPGNPSSEAAALQFQRIIDNGVVSKKGRLSAVLIAVDSLTAGLAKIAVAFVAPGLDSQCRTIVKGTAHHRVLTLTIDLDYVRDGCSVLGVRAQPGSGVEIYLNERTREAHGVEFDAAFKYMAKRVGGRK